MNPTQSLVALLGGTSHALRSYQYGNSSTDLAEDMANKVDALLAKLERGEWVVVEKADLPKLELATRVSIRGMYDMHLFHRIGGRTVDEVIGNWIAHNSQKHPAIVGGREVDDMGQSSLCPATVLSGNKELRRVGKMVFPRSTRMKADLEAYRAALSSDPDIPRLLSAAKEQ